MNVPTIITLEKDNRWVLVERLFDDDKQGWLPQEERTLEYYAGIARHTVGYLRLPSTNGGVPPRCLGALCKTNGAYAHTALPKAPNGLSGRGMYEWHEISYLEQVASNHDRTQLSFENEHDRKAVLAYVAAYGSGSASGSTSSLPTSQM